MVKNAYHRIVLAFVLSCLAIGLFGCGGGGEGGGGSTTTPVPPAATTTTTTVGLPPGVKALCEWEADEKTISRFEIVSCDDTKRTYEQAAITITTPDPIPLNGATCETMMNSFITLDCAKPPDGETNVIKHTPGVSICQQTDAQGTVTRRDATCDGTNRKDIITVTILSALPYPDSEDCDAGIAAWKAGQEITHPGSCVGSSSVVVA